MLSSVPLTSPFAGRKIVAEAASILRSSTATSVSEGFGQTGGQSGSTASPYGYHGSDGYRSDGDTQALAAPLMKVGARYYDPEFGVFLTRDTELDQKPYAYCDGDPVSRTDPTGHLSKYLQYLLLRLGFAVVFGPIPNIYYNIKKPVKTPQQFYGY